MNPMNHEPNSTKRLRTFVVSSNLGVFGTTGLTLLGWLPNFTGLTLAVVGNVTLGFASILIALANLFAAGARQNENQVLWNLLALGALAFLGLGAWKTWGSYGPGGQLVLILLTAVSVLVRIIPRLQTLPPSNRTGGV